MNGKVLFSSASTGWCTPPEIITTVIEVLGAIDLDPCSPSLLGPVPASCRYTAVENGLTLPWHGRVFMNPPYGRTIRLWIQKAVEEYKGGNIQAAVLLLPARTDTRWFALLEDYPWCAVRGRLKFSGCADAAPFPSAVVFLGKDPGKFVEAFGVFGTIYQKVQPAHSVPTLPAYQAPDGVTWSGPSSVGPDHVRP